MQCTTNRIIRVRSLSHKGLPARGEWEHRDVINQSINEHIQLMKLNFSFRMKLRLSRPLRLENGWSQVRPFDNYAWYSISCLPVLSFCYKILRASNFQKRSCDTQHCSAHRTAIRVSADHWANNGNIVLSLPVNRASMSTSSWWNWTHRFVWNQGCRDTDPLRLENGWLSFLLDICVGLCSFTSGYYPMG